MTPNDAMFRNPLDQPEHFTEARPYLMLGEVHAEGELGEYLNRQEGLQMGRAASHLLTDADLRHISPVPLGSRRTSPLVRGLLDSRQYSHLAYRLRVDGRSYVEIANPAPEETKVLASLGDSAVQDASGGRWRLVDEPNGYVFGVVARLRNRFGGGPITMLLSDYPRAIHQLAVALTDEEQLSVIFKRLGWPTDCELPECFEWLFRVDLGHEGFATRARSAEYLCCRVHGEWHN